MMDLRALACALGGEVVNGQVLAPGPGHGRRDRSLSVRLSASSPLGFICHSHSPRDNFADCQRYVCERLGLDPNGWKAARRVIATSRRPPTPVRSNDGPDERTTDALALWRASADPRRTIVETYLKSRALDLGDEVTGEVIRWNASIGAMVALFRNIATDEPQAVSRTYLDREGRKLDRKFLGPVGGGAVKLDAGDAVLGGLHIGEGIETCLAARQLGLRPAWALGSAGAVAAFPVLAAIDCLTLLAEHDDASTRAVETCAVRWHAAGREVVINEPIGAKDLNDAIRRRA